MAGEKETLDRIQEAKEEDATGLDLSGMDLTAVPPEIGQLTSGLGEAHSFPNTRIWSGWREHRFAP